MRAMVTRTIAIVSLTAAASLAAAVPAHAEVHLTIQNGRVSLVAKDATLTQILAEWAKVGKTTIVNGERVPGGPLTLQLTDVPEEQALDTLLRALSGYVAAPRATAVAGLSRFDRIVVMPTEAKPVSATASTAASSPVLPRPMSPAAGPPAPSLPSVHEEFQPDDEVNWNQDPVPVPQPGLTIGAGPDPAAALPGLTIGGSPDLAAGLLGLFVGQGPVEQPSGVRMVTLPVTSSTDFPAIPTGIPAIPAGPAGATVPGMPTAAPRQPAPAQQAVPPGGRP